MLSPLGMPTATAHVAVRLADCSERAPSTVQECTPPQPISRLISCTVFFCNIHVCVVGEKSVRRAATEVGQIRREPPATSGVYPDMFESVCVVSGSVCGEAWVGLKPAGPDGAARRLVPTPAVGGGLSYIWGRRGVRIASPCSIQHVRHCSAAALCLLVRSYASISSHKCSNLLPGARACASLTHELRVGLSSRRRAHIR
jgi:hypothetical protein